MGRGVSRALPKLRYRHMPRSRGGDCGHLTVRRPYFGAAGGRPEQKHHTAPPAPHPSSPFSPIPSPRFPTVVPPPWWGSWWGGGCAPASQRGACKNVVWLFCMLRSMDLWCLGPRRCGKAPTRATCTTHTRADIRQHQLGYLFCVIGSCYTPAALSGASAAQVASPAPTISLPRRYDNVRCRSDVRQRLCHIAGGRGGAVVSR
jgi:hypothetical protein